MAWRLYQRLQMLAGREVEKTCGMSGDDDRDREREIDVEIQRLYTSSSHDLLAIIFTNSAPQTARARTESRAANLDD